MIEKSIYYRGVAQPGSAPALGAGSRRFKSSRPDQDLLNGIFGHTKSRKHLVGIFDSFSKFHIRHTVKCLFSHPERYNKSLWIYDY